MQGRRIYSGSPYEDRVGYARAVVSGDFVFVAGTTGFDPVTKALPEDVEDQCRNCFRNIEHALKEAGGSLADLVRLVIYVGSRPEFERVIPIIREHSLAARPANTTVLAELIDPSMRIEIEATARLPAGG